MRLGLATLAALGLLGAPLHAAAEELYSFVDGEGVIHVTNVPQDPRYHRVRVLRARPVPPGVTRVVIQGRRQEGRTAKDSRRVDLATRRAPFVEHIRSAAERYGLPAPLLEAVMAVESNFDPLAISEKGAEGLMQLMPGTARELEVSDARDPAQNIDGGARYLRQLHDRFGNDLVQVLAAYNAGPEAVKRSGGAVPAIPETQAYVRKVLALYQKLLARG